MPQHQLKTFLLCLGSYLNEEFFLHQVVLVQKFLATVQVKTVPRVGAVKPEVPAGSCLPSRRNGSSGRGDWAVHSVIVVKGRRQSHRKPHVLYLAISVKIFASSWAREELTHC